MTFQTMTSPGAHERSNAVCSICGRGFGKQEHLVRHMRIHTRERPYPCPSCHKSFSRRDVLSRHIAAHNDNNDNNDITTQLPAARACLRCASDRVRCSRGQKCQRCLQRGYNCQYPALRSARGRTADSGTNESTDAFGTNGLHRDDVNSNGHGDFRTADYNGATGESSVSAWAWNNNIGNTMVASDPFSLPGLSLSDVNWLSPQYSGPIDLDALLANFGDHANGTVEQWTCSVAATTPSIPAIASSHPPSILDRTACTSDQRSKDGASVTSSSASENRYYVDGAGARAPFGGKPHHSICSEETMDLQGEDANEAGTPLQASNEDTLCPSAAYQALLEGIATESRDCVGEMNASNFPTYKRVVISVRQYFDNFHPVFPFLRRSSFAQDASNSWLLLLAVSIVGSRYSQESQQVRSNEQLFGLLSAILTRHKYGLDSHGSVANEDIDYSPSCAQFDALPSLQMIQAGILLAVCMLHSGKKALVERAHVERHYLVEGCHALGLLVQKKRSYDLTMATDPEPNPVLHEWLSRQAIIRTGMMIWILDTMFVFEFQAKSLVRLDEIDAALPCHEDIWEQPGLIRQNQRRVPNITLAEALEMMYVEKRLPTDLGEFSMGILASAIYRHTRDVLARDRIRLNSWTPTSTPQRRSDMPPPVQQDWLPTTRSSIKWRNSACDCLDVLHWPANSKVARHSGFEHHTILQLHLARLIILAPTSAIQRFASGSASDEATLVDAVNGQSFATARLQVLEWVIRDHCKARLCLVHCGALFWHVRRYSCSSLFEPYAVYIATLILWAFCVCMHLPEATEAIASESDEEPEPSFLHLDRPLDDELVQTYVRMGHKMSAYIANVGSLEHEAAPVRIAKEGASLLAKGSEVVSSQARTSSSFPQDACYTWGIERSYINLLRLLAKER